MKLDKSATETFDMIKQAYPDVAFSMTATKASIPTLLQPPYRTGVAPPGLLFPSLKRPMKDKYFEATEGFQAVCTVHLKAIPENCIP